MPGKIWFVGAGPGDPDLITVKGRKLLEQALKDGDSSPLPVGRVLAGLETPVDIHWCEG